MKDKQKSIFAMIISTLGFALMGVFVKLTGDLPVIQKVVFRTYIILPTVYLMMRRAGVSLKGIQHWKLLSLRSFLGTIGILLNYYALDHLILSDANVLFRLSTFFLLFFSWVFLGERIQLKEFFAIFIAFIGILLIMKPAFDIKMFPYIIALLGAAFAAGAYTVVRVLGKKEQPLVTVFFFAGFTSIVLTPIAIFTFVPMTRLQVLYAVLAGVSAAIGQVGITYAYKHAPAKEVSIYGYLGVVFSAIFSIVIFHNIPDMTSIIGYIVIFVSSYYMYRLHLKDT